MRVALVAGLFLAVAAPAHAASTYVGYPFGTGEPGTGLGSDSDGTAA
jgi:hypothetical protein